MLNALTLWTGFLEDLAISKRDCIKRLTKGCDTIRKTLDKNCASCVQFDGWDSDELPGGSALRQAINIGQSRYNIPLNQFVDQMVYYFNGTQQYWFNNVPKLFKQTIYCEELFIWEVDQPYISEILINPVQIAVIKRARSVSKQYLLSIHNLAKLIRTASVADLSRIDDQYKKYKSVYEIYTAYWHEKYPQTYVDDDSISERAMIKAKLQLFSFIERPTYFTQSNTLLNYWNNKGDSKNSRRSSLKSNQPIGLEIKNIEKVLQNSKTVIPIEDLRNSYINSEVGESNQKAQSIEQRQETYCFIAGNNYYFWHQCFPITQNQLKYIDFGAPYQSISSINYQEDSQMQFDELQADDIDSADEVYSQIASDSDKSFIVSDGHNSVAGSDDQDDSKKPRLTLINEVNTKTWTFGRQNTAQPMKLAGSVDLPMPLSQFPFQLPKDTVNALIKGKTKKQLYELVQNGQLQVKYKYKFEQYLKANFSRVKEKSSKRTYYAPVDQIQEEEEDDNRIKGTIESSVHSSGLDSKTILSDDEDDRTQPPGVYNIIQIRSVSETTKLNQNNIRSELFNSFRINPNISQSQEVPFHINPNISQSQEVPFYIKSINQETSFQIDPNVQLSQIGQIQQKLISEILSKNEITDDQSQQNQAYK